MSKIKSLPKEDQGLKKLHFKLELKDTKASIELYGKVEEIINGIASAMQQKPDLARVLIGAGYQYLEDQELIVKSQKEE